MAGYERHLRIPSGLAERVDRVRGDEPFEHWIRHHVEAAVLERERALGLVTERQRDQIEAQDADLERARGPGRGSSPPSG
jgi:hypothetical protein